MAPKGVFGNRQSAGSVLVACTALAMVFCWQALTVHVNYGGNWSALFYIGDRWPVPPALSADGLYIFQNNAGYDGTFYHLIAHDPWFERGFARFVDNPSLRWRRILLPALAHGAALGDDRKIHGCYIALNLVFVFLGTWWLARFAVLQQLHPGWGFLFLGVPAVLVSIDRLTIDTALAALTAGFVVHSIHGQRGRAYGLLSLCPLARETGACVVAGRVLDDLRRREWGKAALACAAAIPFVAWSAFVFLRTTRDATPWLSWPLAGLLRRTVAPLQYQVTGLWVAAAAVLDYVAVIGMWAALLVTLCLLARKRSGLIENCAYMLAFAALWLGKADIWAGAYEFGRTMSPLFLLLGLVALRDRKPWFAAPVLLVLPRILLQFEPQVRGILSRI